MQYVAIIDGTEMEVEVLEVSPGQFQVQIEDRRLDVDIQPTSDTTLSCLMNNEAFDVELEKNPDGGDNLLVRGHIMHVEVLDLRKMRLRKAQRAVEGPAGPAEVAAPMPGKVVAVLVAEGDSVEPGQGLLVVEAMKMENELKAPRAGVVRSLTAEEGAAIDGGTTLCVIE